MASQKTLPLIPKGYRVLVKQDPIEKTSKGGIVLHTVAEETRQQKGYCKGHLMAVGDLAWQGKDMGDGEPWAHVGQRVMFSRYAGHAFYKDPDDGSWWHVMNDEDILGTIPPGIED